VVKNGDRLVARLFKQRGGTFFQLRNTGGKFCVNGSHGESLKNLVLILVLNLALVKKLLTLNGIKLASLI
jgi:hypothetical protein